MEKLLLIGLPDTAAIEKIADKLRIRTAIVLPEQYAQSIGSLAGYVSANVSRNVPAVETLPPEGILVMCELKNNRMDRLLEAFRKKELVIPYKAVLTPTNISWNVFQLSLELQRERCIIEKNKNN